MKLKKGVKIAFLSSLSVLMVATSVPAETIYQVKGNSMSPTLKEGDVIQVVDKKYKDGDLVIAKTKTGEEIVKRLKGDFLVGDGDNSISFHKDEVEIIGKVEKSKDIEVKEKTMNITTQAKALEIESPIDKVYAGGEFVLFLHEDTTLTGFGSNINNALGMNGGENDNTSSLVQVGNNKTGYEYLKVSRGRALGFRNSENQEGLYDVYNINELENNKFYPTPVRDADFLYRRNIVVDHLDMDLVVENNGITYSKGNGDYIAQNQLGSGRYRPYFSSTWGYVQDQESLSLTPVTDWTTNTDNTDTLTQITIDNVQVTGNHWAVEFVFQNMTAEYADLYAKVEVYNSQNQLVSKWENSQIYNSNVFRRQPQRQLIMDNSQPGTYKVVISSKKTGWTARVVNRKPIEKITKVETAYDSLGFVLVDENGKVYIHRNGYNYMRLVNFPVGTKIVKESIVSGPDWFLALDENNNLWKWNTDTNAAIVTMPTVNGANFNDLYTIKKATVGKDFYMILTETKDASKETNVWVWGANSYGQLGIPEGKNAQEQYITVNTPTKVTKNGVALTNIRDLDAGYNFTVILQDTNEGQLLWTSGLNNKGQLGGNIDLKINQPFIIPGLTEVEDIFTVNTKLFYSTLPRTFVRTPEKVYSFGSGTSYPKEYNWRGGLLYDLAVPETDHSTYSYVTGATKTAYGNSTGVGADGTYKIRVEEQFLSLNNGSYYFDNVKELAQRYHSTAFLSSDGRIWGYNITAWNGTGKSWTSSRPDSFRTYRYAAPARDVNDEILPNIFVELDGSNNYYFALDNQGKLWTTVETTNPENGLRYSYFRRNFVGTAIDSVKLVTVDGGIDHYLAIDENGEVWAWYGSSYGKTGLGVTNWQNTPIKIPKSYFNNEKVISISAGYNHSLVATESGSVYAFGDNSYGQLGIGNQEDQLRPVKVLNVNDVKKVKTGADYSLALTNDGRVWAWGRASDGSLGNNFSLERGSYSTAIGNDLPQMTVNTPIKTTYLSRTGNQNYKLFGTIRELDAEKTTINATLMGVKKEYTVEKENWQLDIYDEVEKQDWNLEWNIDEIGQEQTFQSLTKVVAEDERGGIIEQYFAGNIVVDNELPSIPDWGETCIIQVSNGSETCQPSDYFKANGTNGVNAKVRLYINSNQKTGLNKAPVHPQVQYRKKYIYGYANDWTDWKDVKTKDANGKYYYDFFEGFLGETQVRVRNIDDAGNKSENNSSTRYVIINNAGGEIAKISGKAFSDSNYRLYNELTFTGSTPSGSAIASYNVDRRDKLKAEKNPTDEMGNPINHWVNLTPERVSWNGSETVFTDNNPVEELKGNATYEYKVDAKNNIAVGQSKTTEVTTNPYIPENLAKAPNDEGMVLSISQDKRNQNSILYRLVITDNMTGNVFTKDYTSNNVNEDIVYDLKGNEVFAHSGVKIVNNSIKIQVLVQGLNKQWVEVLYEENFINSPAISTDTQKPDVMFMIPELYKTIVNGKYGSNNKIQLSLFATDNVSPRHKLQVQFSLDGTNWIGLKQVSPTQKEWIANHWSSYQDIYDNFAMGQTSGKKMIYVRVQDEAGNVTYANAEMVITDPLNRTNPDTGTTTPINDSINGTVITDFSDTTERHVKNPNTKITVPKDGNLTEVQFSFDGVEWSPWEKIGDNGLNKYITLDYGNGNRTVMVRYRNDSGLITDVDSNNDIITYVLDQEKPTGEIKTRNGTLLSTKFTVPLKFFVEDNLSSQVKVTVVGQNENGQPFTLNKVYVNAQGEIDVNTNADGFISGNKVVLNTGTTSYYGVAGLVPNKFNEVRFKLEDKAGNVSYKTIRIYYKQ